MRFTQSTARLLITGMISLSLTACCYPSIAAEIRQAVSYGPSGDFKFDSVAWVRTPTDSNTLTIRGLLTWNKRTSAIASRYWDLSIESGGQRGMSATLVDSAGRTITSVPGTLTVWEGTERVTMVAFRKASFFEFRTPQISPNVVRIIKSVRMSGLMVKTNGTASK
ncbi:MAG: hypothetical protein ACHQSE_10360 [Gemmatimonadales bacterium]